MRFLSTDMKDRNMLFAAITTNQPIRSKCSRLPDLHDFFPTNISSISVLTQVVHLAERDLPLWHENRLPTLT